MSRRLFAIILMIWSSIHKGVAFRPIVARGLFHRTVTRLSQSSEDIGLLRVPELKDRLRAAGLPVSGRKTELIERLQRGSSVAQLFAAPSAARSDVDADPLPTIVGPAVLIAACKSWGAFKKKAAEISAVVGELDGNVAVYGHARGKAGSPSAWTPRALAGRPIKGALVVAAVPAGREFAAAAFTVSRDVATLFDGAVVVSQSGPEDRPFPHLRALDTAAIAKAAVEATQRDV